MMSFTTCTLCQILFNKIKDEMGRACGMHGTREMHTIFWLENLKGRDHFEDLGTDGRIILKWILKK